MKGLRSHSRLFFFLWLLLALLLQASSGLARSSSSKVRDRRPAPLRCSTSSSPRPTSKPKPSKSNPSPRRQKIPQAPTQGKKPSGCFSFLFRSVQQVARDGSGRIVRSFSARRRFLDSLGLEKLPKGYEVDHVKPLFAGGKDHESNMQLLPKKVHQEKTRQDFKRYKEQLAASRQSNSQKASTSAKARRVGDSATEKRSAIRSSPASTMKRTNKSSNPSTARNGKDSGLFGFLSRLFG